MRSILSIVIFVVAIAAIMGSIASAKDENAGQKMEAPKMPAEISKLDVFIGNWQGTGILQTTGQQPQQAEITHKYEKLSFGWGLRMQEFAKIAGMDTYEAMDLLGYDIGGGKFHLYTISNYGDTHDHVGSWTDDKHLYFEYNGTMDGKPFVEKLPISVDSPNQYSFADSVFVGGELAQTLIGTMKKIGK